LEGLKEYAEENISPDVYEEFEEIIKDTNKCPKLIEFIDYVNGYISNTDK
jgi:hypothetical protein